MTTEGTVEETSVGRRPIRVLPPTVAARIAAGEVIERPASVVKELVENAIDSGARTVEVAIWGGGIDRIRVTDDGCGIPATELADAFERHATSKLTTEHDLFDVHTLGFRGEALAAIAAAGDVDFVTRPAAERAAAVARARHGRVEHLGSAGAAPGTSVEVRELFGELPARRRFLRAAAAESRVVAQAVEAYALAYPQVAFRLTVDDRRVLATDGSGDERAAFAAVHGAGVASELLPVTAERVGEDGQVRVSGLVGPPQLHRAHRRALTLFANGRLIASRPLAHAVEEAFAGLLPIGRYPVGFLHIHVPPDEVDVNVHPTKAEVRFRHERLVYAVVGQAVRAALGGATTVRAPQPSAGVAGEASVLPPWTPPPTREAWAAARQVIAGAQAASRVGGLDVPAADAETQAASVAAQGALPLHARLPALRALGQVDATYIVAEAPDGLCLVDQHAAHERVLYEQIRAARAAGRVEAQPLLTPAVVALSATQIAMAAEHAEALTAVGFALDETDGAALIVRAVPTTLAGRDPARALAEYLDRLGAAEDRTAGADRVAATLACRAAVMAGDPLDTEQQRALLRALEACETPQTCPHGRPTMLYLSTDALARSFGRS
ncbi:MAG: DNA mismatch repair endonuclease MutL [Dehalococcoidia bacterium]